MGHAAHDRTHPAPTAPPGYQRRRPEETALYQTIAEHFPAFLERAEQAGGLPRFVVREFEEYLRCGRLDRGCLHLVCRSCGYSQLVALSCKGRAFCPSCLGRKMVDSSVHLEQSVLPQVPIRHWIGSFPWGLRALLGYDKKLCSKVCSAFMTELGRSLRRRAKRLLGLPSVADAHTGAVVAVQRTDSALRLNVHLHALVLDGVYVRDADSSKLVFHALPTPTRAEVADVARRTADRIERVLRAAGRSLDPADGDDTPPELALEEPGLAACYSAAAQGIGISGQRAGQPSLRLVVPTSPQPQRSTENDPPDEPIAEVRGINVYAKQCVDGRDRRRVERLARYITRPPVAQDRLSRRPDGRLELELKSIWKDGTRALVLEPHDLISRLVAAAPPPYFHMLRYFGVLSSHATLRSEVVPRRETAKDDASISPPPAAGDQLDLGLDPEDDGHRAPPRKRWAWLLAHVFQADLEHCPRCGGPMRWQDVATTEDAAARLMAKHGLAPQPPPAARPPPLGQLELPLS